MKVEIRKDGTALITGYVNVVGRESRVLQDISGEFVEVIEPGTFARALSKVDSVGLCLTICAMLTLQTILLSSPKTI